MAEVRIYNKALTSDEVTALLSEKKTITVNYVDAQGSTIAANTSVDYFSDDATFTLPTSIITDENVAYKLTGFEYEEGVETVTATAAGTSYTAAYESVEALPTGIEALESVCVIDGNEPVLPKTVTVLTNKTGITFTADVTWDTSSLAVGTNVVSGTVDGYEDLTAEVNVTVIDDTFGIRNDIEAYAGENKAAIHYFPVEFDGNVTFEFDVVFDKLVNGTITLGSAAANNGNCPVFGDAGDNISIQTNASGINVRSWGTDTMDIDKDGATDDWVALINETYPVEIGKKYRFFVTTDIANKTWSATMTAEDGTITTIAENFVSRNAAASIDSLTVFDNDSQSDTLTVSNFKVYAPNQHSEFATYTVTITGAGDNNATYTENAIDYEGVIIPAFENYILADRALDKTNRTITYSYEERKDTIGTWAVRNNVHDYYWMTEVKFLGTHNSFANTDDVVDNEGGELYGQKAATLGNITLSKAQTLSALGQLNAGVRYFDIRLSRQSDGNFMTVHGGAFNYLRPILTTIAQFAEENPGEVILLDFQSTVDALYKTVIDDGTGADKNGDPAGDDNADVYAALVELLNETGIMNYACGTSSWNTTYGNLTNNGENSKIIIIGKGRANINFPNVFLNRDSVFGNDGYLEPVEDTLLGVSIGTTQAVTSDMLVEHFNGLSNGWGNGARWGLLHAYATPASANTTATLIGWAEDANEVWLANSNFATWMGSGNGDILILNNVTEEVGAKYLAALNKYNRDGYDGTYGNHKSIYQGGADYDGVKIDDITVTGADTSVPYSTEFDIVKTASTAAYTVDGIEYTAANAYDVALVQFNTDEVSLNGEVTLTFPKLGDGVATVDAILSADGTTVLATSELGESVTWTTSALADVIHATRLADGVNLAVEYVAGGEVVYSAEAEYFGYGATVYSIKQGDFYIEYEGNAYVVRAESDMTYVASEEDADNSTVQAELTLISKYAVLEDTFFNDSTDESDNRDWNEKGTGNYLFISAKNGVNAAPTTDADGVATYTGGNGYDTMARTPLLTFKVPALTGNQAVKLHVTTILDSGKTATLGDGEMKLAAGVVSVADGKIEDVNAKVAEYYTITEDIVWSDEMVTISDEAVIDVTKYVQAASGETITFALYAPTSGVRVADRECTYAGGTYAGKAAYLEVVDGAVINGADKVVKNGTAFTGTSITVAADATAKAYSTKAYAATDAEGAVTKLENGVAELALTANNTYTLREFGITVINGAQVRIGGGVTDENRVGTNSGLRFIAAVNGDETLAGMTEEFGLMLEAEAGETPQYVKAEKWQDSTTFTVAITNILEGNYNRNFTATPYVVINGETFVAPEENSVTRSIYKVAAGLLANNSDNTEYDNSALESEILYKVLNAYVNQTGIRLTLDKTTNTFTVRATGSGAYSGNAFFTVGETTYDETNGTYTVTLEPVGEKTEILKYWKEYIRVNNNHSAVQGMIADAEVAEDGTLTITMTIN